MRAGFTAIELIVFVCEVALGVTVSVAMGNRFGGTGFVLGFIIGFGIIPGLFYGVGYGVRVVHNLRTRYRAREGPG